MSLREHLSRRLAEMSRRASGQVPSAGEDSTCSEDAGAANRAEAGWTLAELLPTGREWTGNCGTCWVLIEDLRQTWHGSAHLLEWVRPARSAPPAGEVRGWPHAWRGSTVAAIDIETCGFAAAPIFMIGLMETDGASLVLRQGLARDYAEEAALLEWAAHRLTASGGVITFNGRTFDIPYVRDRQRYYRHKPLGDLPHLDLLHIARRIWGADLPDCRLQTLELYLTGRARKGDIPGREIPDVYHTFVDTGNARHMRTIIQHNRLDLITLMELFGAAWHHVRREVGNARRGNDERNSV